MLAKIHPFKYIEVCKELFALFQFMFFGWLVTFAIKYLLSKPTLNFDINKVDVPMYLCPSITWFGELHDANKNIRARNGPA